MAPEPEELDWRQDEYDGIPPRYMAVTADKYELPVAVFDNIQDLSRWAHKHRHGTRRHYTPDGKKERPGGWLPVYPAAERH